MRPRFAAALPLAIAALALAACGSGDDASKAGGSGPAVTLRIGTAEFANSAGTDSMETFAREVEALSDRRLRIKLVWAAAGTSRAWDQRVARKVVAGDLDMGLISARAWDTEGVTSMRALHAPFLVTNDELVDDLVTGELADEMLAGVEELGLVGLALVPESLGHPVGLSKPLVALGDYDGITVQAPRSETSFGLFRALGATPIDLNGDSYLRAARSGAVQGEDISFALAHTIPGSSIFTGNVTLYPKVRSLVVNREAYDGLTDEQREILRKAAEATREHISADRVPDEEAAALYCAEGGRIVTAGDAQVRALEQAADPVYAELEADAATATMIDRIRELKSEQPASASAEIEPCAGDGSPASEPATRDADEQQIPNGAYRASMTEAELLRAGLPPDQENYDGVHTLTFEDGELVDELKNDTPGPPCLGSYTSSRTTLELRFESNCSGSMSAHWSVRDGYLHLSRIGSRETPSDVPILRAVFGTKPFRKIG